MFVSDYDLHRDFSFINVPEKIPKKIYFYFYKIKYSSCLHNKPYIVMLLEKNNKLNEMIFPFIDVDVNMCIQTIFNDFSNIQSLFMDICIDGLAKYIISHSFLANYNNYYKGFCNTTDGNILMVFDGCDLDTKYSLVDNLTLTPCVLDEVLNHNRVDDIIVNNTVFNSILHYEELIFLRNSSGENETIPYILYSADDTENDARRNINGKYGNFFYFVAPLTENGMTGKRYIGFIDHEKVYCVTESAATTTTTTAAEIDDVKMMESSIVFFIKEGIPHWCIKDTNLFNEVAF